MEPPTISVVVPTRNSAGQLGILLDSVTSQTVPPLEVIVVDCSDTYETREVGLGKGARVVLYPPGGDRRGYARNLGAKHACGTALLFLDSDMELEPQLIQSCQQALEGGSEASIIPEKNLGSGLLGRTRAWERAAVSRVELLTFARLIRKDIFETVGGFSESIIGFEDLDLQATLIEKGVSIGKLWCGVAHHEEGLGVGAYLRKRRYYRKSAELFTHRHPKLSKQVFSPLERIRTYAQGVCRIDDLIPFGLAISLRLAESL